MNLLRYLWQRFYLSFKPCIVCHDSLGWFHRNRNGWFRSISSGKLMHTKCLGLKAWQEIDRANRAAS